MMDPGVSAAIGSIMVAVAGLGTGTYLLTQARKIARGYRNPWTLFAAATLCWGVGGALAAIGHLATDLSSNSHGAGNVAYLAGMIVFSVAVAIDPALSPRVVRVRACANAVILSASLVTLAWFAIGRLHYERSGDLVATIGALVYPAGDMALVALGTTIAIRVGRTHAPHAPTARATALTVVCGFVAFMVGDLAHLTLAAFGRSTRLPVAELIWVLGFALIVHAARSATAGRVRRAHRRDDPRLAAALGLAPVCAAVLAGAAAFIDWHVRDTVDAPGMLLLTLVVTMVLGRQSLTMSDNRRLGDDLRRVVADLEHQATHDGLTGLPNRSGLADRIRGALELTESTNRRAALLFVDLDHLKPVNDSLGHGAGDTLLRTTATRIAARVGPTVTRFGGDEFVVVLEDLPAADATASAELIGRMIVSDTARPIEIAGHPIRPSVSVGIAVAEPGIGPDELMRRADLALYRAKARGRRCVAAYDPATESDARRLIDLESELRRALRNDEFEVHYQPVVELSTGRITGVESLLRWRHPERGLLTPDAFLDEAAASGLLGLIGENTLMRVCADMAPIRGTAGQPTPTVAVNLSTTELTDARLVPRVRSALQTFGLEPARLTIEITEDVIVDAEIRNSIDELRSLGVHLSIDDFGTGNSSLRQLGTYPAETLKIDRSFIARLDADDQQVAIVRAILGLARNLGLRTVAEGVETAEQADLLAQLGCDYAQGWLYAKSMPIDELEHFLATRPVTRREAEPDPGWQPPFHPLSALDRRAVSRGAPVSNQPRP